MAPLVRLTAVHSKVIVVIVIVIALTTSNVITADEQERPLSYLRLGMPRDAVMVGCRFNRTNLLAVNMSVKGDSANVIFFSQTNECIRADMFSHCQLSHDSVTIWTVVMNVTVTNSRTVFCNRTTDAGQHRIMKSFNITVGVFDTDTEQVSYTGRKQDLCSSNTTSVSSVMILVVVAVLLQAVVSSHQRLSPE